jgi:hypothetical protein
LLPASSWASCTAQTACLAGAAISCSGNNPTSQCSSQAYDYITCDGQRTYCPYACTGTCPYDPNTSCQGRSSCNVSWSDPSSISCDGTTYNCMFFPCPHNPSIMCSW